MPSKYGFPSADEQDDHRFVDRMKQALAETAARLDPVLTDILSDYAVANSFAGVASRADDHSWRLGPLTIRIIDHSALSVTVSNALPVAVEPDVSQEGSVARLVRSANLMALCTVLCEQTNCQVVLTAPVPGPSGTKELRGYIWDPSDVRTPEQL
jgi:hypothetical protein